MKQDSIKPRVSKCIKITLDPGSFVVAERSIPERAILSEKYFEK